jgi:nitroimidazol reductase NimA-like FMN-containing flavoprotein (pyridoxamine 5'-phosphate oxidase superfamily)
VVKLILVGVVLAGVSSVRVTFEQVDRELRRRSFGVLGTVSKGGKSHSVGVVYGVSPTGEPLALYVMADSDSKKARNIAGNPNVSFTVPLFRRVLTFAPPNCIQFQGTAEIVPFEDEGARRAFSGSILMKRMMSYVEKHFEGKPSKLCYIRIEPDPVIFTYGLGLSLMELAKHIGEAHSKVKIPPEHL